MATDPTEKPKEKTPAAKGLLASKCRMKFTREDRNTMPKPHPLGVFWGGALRGVLGGGECFEGCFRGFK